MSAPDKTDTNGPHLFDSSIGDRPGRRETEQLQEIIIKAHYLAMELRYICAGSGIGAPALSLGAADMLKQWACAFAADLAAARSGPERSAPVSNRLFTAMPKDD